MWRLVILFHLMAFKLQLCTDNYEISNPSPDLSPEFQAHMVTCLIGMSISMVTGYCKLITYKPNSSFSSPNCSSGGLCISVDGNSLLPVVQAQISHCVNLKIYPEINCILFASFLSFLPWSDFSHLMQSLSNWFPCFHPYPKVYAQQSHQDNFLKHKPDHVTPQTLCWHPISHRLKILKMA